MALWSLTEEKIELVQKLKVCDGDGIIVYDINISPKSDLFAFSSTDGSVGIGSITERKIVAKIDDQKPKKGEEGEEDESSSILVGMNSVGTLLATVSPNGKLLVHSLRQD